jgi:hypothetical protein
LGDFLAGVCYRVCGLWIRVYILYINRYINLISIIKKEVIYLRNSVFTQLKDF